MAKDMFREIVDAYIQIYGEIHPSTINGLINLGTVHKDLGEHDEAVKIYEKAIEGRK